MTCRRLITEKLPEKLKVTVTAICQEAEKLENIVGDFDELLKNRKSMFSYEDFNAVVKDVEPVFAREAEMKKVRFSLTLSPEPLRINAQIKLLTVAILILLRNSLDATSEGGLIAIQTWRTHTSVDLTIKDTGKGIVKEYLERIFDPFFSTKENSFGIGLSLARQIISQHMGEIKVESEVGKGTTFKIMLPIRWVETRSSRT